VHYLDNAH